MSDKTISNLKPRLLLRELSRRCPNVWDYIKKFRSGKEKAHFDWPDWCYMPIAAGHAISSGISLSKEALFDPLLNPASITALATWRVSQGIYRFDADLFNALIHQPFVGKSQYGGLKVEIEMGVI